MSARVRTKSGCRARQVATERVERRWVQAISGSVLGVVGRFCRLRAMGTVGFAVDFEDDGAVDKAIEECSSEV